MLDADLNLKQKSSIRCASFDLQSVQSAIDSTANRSDLQQLSKQISGFRNQIFKEIAIWELLKKREIPIDLQTAFFNPQAIRGVGYITLGSAAFMANHLDFFPNILRISIAAGQMILAVHGALLVMDNSSIFKRICLRDLVCNQRHILGDCFDKMHEKIDGKMRSTIKGSSDRNFQSH